MPSLVRVVLRPRSAWLGIAVICITLAIAVFWVASGLPSPCADLLRFAGLLQDRYWTALIALFLIASVLFLTVLPTGTPMILLAGYYLGPEAALFQYAGLAVSSAVLFECSVAADPAELERELLPWPVLARLAHSMRDNGLAFCILLRLVPVIPSAVASLGATYFGIGRAPFYASIALAGWVRPLFFAWAGSQAANLPVCTGL